MVELCVPISVLTSEFSWRCWQEWVDSSLHRSKHFCIAPMSGSRCPGGLRSALWRIFVLRADQGLSWRQVLLWYMQARLISRKVEFSRISFTFLPSFFVLLCCSWNLNSGGLNLHLNLGFKLHCRKDALLLRLRMGTVAWEALGAWGRRIESLRPAWDNWWDLGRRREKKTS